MFIKHDGYSELQKYIKQTCNWQIFGTLTFAKNTNAEDAVKALTCFWNMVDRALLGNLSYRKNLHVKRLCFLQNGLTNNNNHIHFVANSPLGVKTDDFVEILKYFWISKIYNAGKEIRIEGVKNIEAVSRYLTHEFYKLGNDTWATKCSFI